MIVCIPREVIQDEKRVALVPELVAKVRQAGLEVRVQPGAGEAAGFLDAGYQEKGAGVADNVFADADIVLKVQPPTSDEIRLMKEQSVLIGFLQPYTNKVNIE